MEYPYDLSSDFGLDDEEMERELCYSPPCEQELQQMSVQEEWRKEPSRKRRRIDGDYPARTSELGRAFTFERVIKKQCESDDEYFVTPGALRRALACSNGRAEY